jgi:hypothetical protein
MVLRPNTDAFLRAFPANAPVGSVAPPVLALE